MSKEKEYTNNNGITTVLVYISGSQIEKNVCFGSVEDYNKWENMHQNRTDSRKIELGTSCKKTLDAINDKIESEWVKIMLSSDTNWKHTDRYNRLSSFRDKLVRKNQQWCV